MSADTPLSERCPCGHVVDEDGYCLVEDEHGKHRVRRWSSICVDCARDVRNLL